MRGTWQGSGTFQIRGGGGGSGTLLAIIAAVVLPGSGAALAAVRALAVVLIMAAVLASRHLTGGQTAGFSYVTKRDRPRGRSGRSADLLRPARHRLRRKLPMDLPMRNPGNAGGKSQATRNIGS